MTEDKLNLLIGMVADKFYLSREEVFSRSREPVILESISMLVYILNVKLMWDIKRIHKYLLSKGYTNKTIKTVYNRQRDSFNCVNNSPQWKKSADEIYESLLLVKNETPLKKESLIKKLKAVEDLKFLDSLEFQIINQLKLQFFEKEEKKKKKANYR